MLDLDRYRERAAIMEYDGGLTRFEAETLAAKAQGFTRWQALEALKDADGHGHSGRSGDHRPALRWDAANDLPGVQLNAAEQDGSVSERDVPAGRDRLALLALRA